MPFLFRLLARTGLLASLTIATPIVPDLTATKSTACSPSRTYIANLDALAVGSTPTPGYMAVAWDGWTVENATTYCVKAESSHNVARSSSAEMSTITIDSGEVVMGLESFYFACISLMPGYDLNEYFPASCSIMVSGIPGTYLLDIASVGPYPFTPNSTAVSEGILVDMTMVAPKLGSSQYYFQVVSGAPSTLVLIDNVVMAQQNDCPS